MEKITCVFCVNDSYAKYIGVTIKSIAENNRNNDVDIYVLTDFFNDETTLWLNALAETERNITIHINLVDDSKLRGLKDTWSIYTWYRVLIPEILPKSVRRVLYLDADVIVKDDISELFSIDMTDKSIAAVIDIESANAETFLRCGYDSSKGYVCAGVMLMNLDYWREYNLSEKIVKWGFDHNDCIKFPDQDTINFICQDSKIILPLRYGIVDKFFTCDDYYLNQYRQELKAAFYNPGIVHYAGQSPWVYEKAKHVLQFYWDQYNQMLVRPVKRDFESRGLLLLKIIIWGILHRNEQKIKYNIIKNKVDAL